MIEPVKRSDLEDTLTVAQAVASNQSHATAIIISLLIMIIRIMVYGMEKQDDARLDAGLLKHRSLIDDDPCDWM